ncbi:c-type cytochrome [Methylophaga sp. OBS4]|uniref:c-type cytochrome n=1 Tax=Methylophaga sp. OBS4 TaxID=2991935 RepID=UPI0022523E89|nr:cytochrome c [Methylophaga sp. OBS4]MCX4187920.1 cytochrome c [Methylophaga sp. OBS4]
MKIKPFWLLSMAALSASISSQSFAIETSESFTEGKKLYEKNCLACHQANGQGMRGAFPPLAGSDYLMADKQRAISIPLKGLQGKITVNGDNYNSAMPAFTNLKDNEIAHIMTYVMNAWGNQGELVTADEVTQIRNGN